MEELVQVMRSESLKRQNKSNTASPWSSLDSTITLPEPTEIRSEGPLALSTPVIQEVTGLKNYKFLFLIFTPDFRTKKSFSY